MTNRDRTNGDRTNRDRAWPRTPRNRNMSTQQLIDRSRAVMAGDRARAAETHVMFGHGPLVAGASVESWTDVATEETRYLLASSQWSKARVADAFALLSREPVTMRTINRYFGSFEAFTDALISRHGRTKALGMAYSMRKSLMAQLRKKVHG